MVGCVRNVAWYREVVESGEESSEPRGNKRRRSNANGEVSGRRENSVGIRERQEDKKLRGAESHVQGTVQHSVGSERTA